MNDALTIFIVSAAASVAWVGVIYLFKKKDDKDDTLESTK